MHNFANITKLHTFRLMVAWIIFSRLFRYIHENFTNAPSMDLGPEILEMLVQLMLVSF